MKIILLLSLFIINSEYAFSQPAYSNFTTTDLKGNPVMLDSLLNRGPVFISFWATWCKPSKDQMKFMQSVYTKYKEQGFTYLAIAQDNHRSISLIEPFVTSNKFTFPVILDSEKAIFYSYNSEEVPASFLINSRKEVVFSSTGYTENDDKKIEDEIDKILLRR
ncbi:thiol-disulfide oxidoreductase ResA [soil metagenome]